jgi:hypothetical protein
MSKEMGVILLGVWVIIVPYLGVPSGWRTIILVLSGIAVMILGFLLRAQELSAPRGSKNTFMENRGAHIEHDYSKEKDDSLTSLN